MSDNKGITRRSLLKSLGAMGGVALLIVVSSLGYTQKVFGQGGKTIKIGFITALSGPYSPECRDLVDAATLAMEEFNSKGGVLGRKVELLVRDDKLKIDEGARRAKELLEKERVDFMMGGMISQLVVNEQCKKAKKLFIGCTKSNELTQAPDVSPYTFAEAASPHMVTQAVGPWVFKNLGKKWLFLAADYPWGWQFSEGFDTIGKKLGYSNVGYIKHPLAATDYTTYFPKILAAKPEVLIINNFGKDQLNSVKQVYEFGLKRKMKVVCPIILTASRVGAGDDAFEDVYGGTTFYWELQDIIPSAKAFVTNFRKRYGRPPVDYSAYAYSAMRNLLTAINKTGGMDTKKIVTTLEGYVYDNYKGKQWYRPWDHRSIQDIFIIRSKGAKERAGREWDIYKIIDTVKADEKLARSAEQLGLKGTVPLSNYF